MIVVFAIDALEYTKVEEYGCANLKQAVYGKTDISEFSQPRTMVLWSSFMTGKNKEKEILAKGDKDMWNTRIPLEETFFSKFEDPYVIDLPGFNYDLKVHEKSRELLKSFFEVKDNEAKAAVLREYNKDAFEHHRRVKEEFIKELGAGHDFVLGYFSIADVIGHLNFGNNVMMKMIYKDLDELAARIHELTEKCVVLSDHGMEAIGRFGDHSKYGFWSLSTGHDLINPKITEIKDIILSMRD
jgi:hypothetical protein